VLPEVSADGRFIALDFHGQICKVGEQVPLFPVTTFITPVFEGGAQGQPVPFTQFIQQPQVSTLKFGTKACVADGQTVVLGGYKTVREERQGYSPPVLSKIPYGNRMFKKVGYSPPPMPLLGLV